MSAAVRKPEFEARVLDELKGELRKVEAMLKEITKKLNDPDVELSAMMRLTISQNELLAYIRGIRYALGDEESFEPQVEG